MDWVGRGWDALCTFAFRMIITLFAVLCAGGHVSCGLRLSVYRLVVVVSMEP